MRAELKWPHSPDVDLDTWWPEDKECFRFQLQAMIGPEGMEGEESFDMLVVTPKWLLKNHSPEDVVPGHPMLLVFEHNLPRIRQLIERRCGKAIGETWQDVARQLSWMGHWEFEDFTP